MDIAEKLVSRCLKDREAGMSAQILKDLKSDNSVYSLLAILFYDFREGGFAQFVYNANGIYLPEMAEVLTHVGAAGTNGYLDRVISHCIENNDGYNEFLQGDFSDCPFKDGLNSLSEEFNDSDAAGEIVNSEKIAKTIGRAERA